MSLPSLPLSPRTGANPRASTTSATPSSRSAAIDGISIATNRARGAIMPNLEQEKWPRDDETRDGEHERVRSSNDRDQQLEREGTVSNHNRGYDEAAQGTPSKDTDPDSAESDVNRDDEIDAP